MRAAGVLGPAWGALVLAAGWRRRPRATRVRQLWPGLRSSPPLAERLPAATRALTQVGSLLRHAARRPPDRAADLRAGQFALAVGVVTATVSPMAGIGLGFLLVLGRRRFEARRRVRSASRVADDLPDVVDLLVLAAGAGLTVPLAIDAVARTASGPVGEGLADVSRRRRMGVATSDAVAGLVSTLGESIRPLTTVLVNSDRYGTPLGPALEQMAAELRSRRRRRAEESARRVPVKLIFPLVLCALPAVALLTVVPLLLATLGSLDL